MDPDIWAAIASAITGAGGSMLNNAMNNSKGGSEGQTVYNFNDPQDAAMRAQSQQYMSNVLNGLQAGQAPAWLNNYLNPEQAYLMQQNQQQMFGMPGNAGGSIMDVANSMGAASGIGGQAAMSPGNNALAQYAQRMNGINQYISGLKTNYMTNASQTVPGQLSAASAPRNQIAYNSIPGTPNTAPQLNLSGLSPLLSQGMQSIANGMTPNANNYSGFPSNYYGNYSPDQQSYQGGPTTPQGYNGTYTYPGIPPQQAANIVNTPYA